MVLDVVVKNMMKNSLIVFLSVFFSACQMQPASIDDQNNYSKPPKESIKIEAPFAWGGEGRCSALGCLLGLVEHENNMVAVHKIQGNTSTVLGKVPVGYHPDSAFWIDDEYLGAAVEFSQSLDIFKIQTNKIEKIAEHQFSFRPRNGLLVEKANEEYTLLAVPYSGSKIGWVKFNINNKTEVKTTETTWCEAPWHPSLVDYYPGGGKKAVAVACRGDGHIIAAPVYGDNWPIKTLATFKDVPRQVKPSPSGKWLYVSLELNEYNARINMLTGAVQKIKIPGNGSFSVAPISDDFVAWGVSNKIYLQKINDDGEVMEQRFLATSGFSSDLKKYDINKDGYDDLIVFNSNNEFVDILFGPLWDRANVSND